MLFKDIKQNYPVFILNKQDLSLIQGKATQAPFPRMEMRRRASEPLIKWQMTLMAMKA